MLCDPPERLGLGLGGLGRGFGDQHPPGRRGRGAPRRRLRLPGLLSSGRRKPARVHLCFCPTGYLRILSFLHSGSQQMFVELLLRARRREVVPKDKVLALAELLVQREGQAADNKTVTRMIYV